MSYALRPQDGGSARLLSAAARQQPAAGTESDLVKDSAKVQEAIQAIQKEAAYIQKQARLLRTARHYTPGERSAREAAQAARAAGEEAKRLLQGLAVLSGSASEQSAQRLRHQKLTESVAAVLAELETSRRDCEAAEAARAEAGGAGLALEEQEPAPKDARVRMGGDIQLQETEVATQAEVETHAEAVGEYAQQMGVVARQVMDMRRALLDLADHTRAQGLMAESIEQNMSRASDSTTNAGSQIQVANQKQLKATKCVLWTLLLAVILGFAVIGVTAWKKS